MIAIHAAGAMTPVGLELVDTMAALYTRVQLVTDLNVLDSDGEPLSGMKIPFVGEPDGPARITAIAHAVVDEATLSLEPSEKVPLILCCPEAAAFPQAAPDFPAQLLSAVITKCAIQLDRTRSRIVPRGRAGTLEALGTALALLKDPSVPYCLVGGVDSLIDDARVQSLIDDNRLITESNKDGFIAGEAGAMLLLTNRPADEAMAVWLAASAGREEAIRGSDRPITGAGLVEAMSRALAQAKVPFHSLVGLAHDFSGEERYFEELLQANSRLTKAQGTTTTYDLGLSVGETGAAAGFLAIVMMAFLHWKGVHKQPTMAVLSCDGPERGAVVLGPFTEQAFARQGR